MILPTYAVFTVVRLRYGRTTDHGADVADYTSEPAELPITGCWLEPTESQEVVDGRLAVRTGYTVQLPPGTDLVADDHVRFEGREYEVVGDVLQVRSGSGTLDHARTTIVRWEG